MRARGAWALCAACGLALSGCWSRLETNELGIVIAYGVDYAAGTYRVTASILAPKALPTPGQTQANPTQPAQVLMTGTGPTPGAAFAAVNAESSRRIFWASAEVAVLGQGLAEHGLAPYLAAATHLPGFRPTIRLLVAHGTARQVFGVNRSGLETSTGRELFLTLTDLQRSESFLHAPMLFDLLRWNAEMDRAALLPAITAAPPALPEGVSYRFPDSAVIASGHLAGFLPRTEVRPLLWMEGLFSHGTFAVTCPGRPAVGGAVLVTSARRALWPVVRGGRIVALEVRLSGTGQVAQGCPLPTTSASMGLAAERSLLQEAVKALDWAQAHRVDVVGFGEGAYRRRPQLFLQRYAADWPQAFGRLPIGLTAQVRITQPGLTP